MPLLDRDGAMVQSQFKSVTKFYLRVITIPTSSKLGQPRTEHYNDSIMGPMAPQITSLTIVYSAVYSGADQRQHQSSASLAFVRGIHRGPVNSPHKWPVTRKMFLFDDVIMERRYPCNVFPQRFRPGTHNSNGLRADDPKAFCSNFVFNYLIRLGMCNDKSAVVAYAELWPVLTRTTWIFTRLGLQVHTFFIRWIPGQGWRSCCCSTCNGVSWA